MISKFSEKNSSDLNVLCIYLHQDFSLEKLAEACLRYTPQIALGEGCIFLEIGKCTKLYSQSTLLLRVQVLLKRFDLKASLAFGEDIASAKAFAFFKNYNAKQSSPSHPSLHSPSTLQHSLQTSSQQIQSKKNLPIDALPIFFDPFPKNHSFHQELMNLRRLGIKTLGEFLELSPQSLASRFGKKALMMRDQITRSVHTPWPTFKVPEKIFECTSLDEIYSIKELEPLLFILKPMVDRSLLRLRGHGKLLLNARLILQQEKYSHVHNPLRHFDFDFAFPQGSCMTVMAIIKERLDQNFQQNPLESEVRTVEFHIIKSVFGLGRQKDFFSNKEQEEEALHTVLARLTEKLGFSKVFRASPIESYFPEKCWSKSLEKPTAKVNNTTSQVLPPRPLRLLRIPEELQRIDSILICKKKRWQIIQMHGPEKLSGDWWNHDEERAYYHIETKSGEQLWVYQTPRSPHFFLQGIFD